MNTEHEIRFHLSHHMFNRLASHLDWDEAEEIIDIMMGPHGIESMSSNSWVIRLRMASQTVRMQFKKRLPDPHEHLEIDVGIDSLPSAIEMLHQMGLKLGLIIARTRRKTSIDETIVALDDIPCLGHFVEIEGKVPGEFHVPTALTEYLASHDECKTYGDLIIERLRNEPAWADGYRTASMSAINHLQLGLSFNLMEAGWLTPQ
ncbi:MAG TPA: CYTH domain-containing protein [Streptosporangiaceae bacterium]|nr:CYTH domain-containing protein [Streptosporangiaceae bacterium]